MQNRTSVFVLTLIITILSLYYLSFSVVSWSVENEATLFATDEKGIVNFQKKQQYLDSLWEEPVYDMLFTSFTLKEIKEKELNLGLDLQGGMHVTLEVSPVNILKVLSDNSQNPYFLEAIEDAKLQQKNSQRDFTILFFESFEKNTTTSLASIFANNINRGLIDFNDSDEKIKEVIFKEIEGAIDRTFNIIRTRIDKFGVSQPNIQRIPGTGRIQVELPGADNPQRVRKLLQGVAKLEFLEVWETSQVFPYIQNASEYFIKQQKNQTVKEETPSDQITGLVEQMTPTQVTQTLPPIDETDSLDFLGNQFPLIGLLKSSNGLFYSKEDSAEINAILNQKEIKNFFPSNAYFVWSVKPRNTDGEEIIELLLVKRDRNQNAPLTGEVMVDARQGFDQNGRPEISMTMNVEGAKIWKRMTAQNMGKRIAIVLDNYVYSAPYVQSVIQSGRSSITGNFTLEEAQDLANILKAGKLPAPVRIVEEAVIGPSLGKMSQQQGLISITIGFIVVILFMLFYYGKGGNIANIALLFNVFFIVGILAQLNASLTLPGIAGMVLTIGMSIDANVLIFERIKEEALTGVNSLAQVIKQGYGKVFWTIFDANLTTLLTAIFLYVYGSGPIRGFAVTLMIGIFSSFFTSIFITRMILLWVVRNKKTVKEYSFTTFLSRFFSTQKHFNFIKKKKIAYLFSLSLISTGIVVLLFNGLNFGVDFKGGRAYTIQFSEQINPTKMELALVPFFENAGIETKLFGSDNVMKLTTSYLVDDESQEADEKVRMALIEGLSSSQSLTYAKNEFLEPQQFYITSTTKVGATIADDIEQAAKTSVIYSLLAIFVYIWLRFRRWKFGLAAVIALFHDILMVISVFAIFTAMGIAFEIDQVFVAAMLTIIGYSINDTVVVFDRIREVNKQKKKEKSSDLFNLAINKTLNRTMITSLTTLLVVVILLLFGGEVLRGFSFALFIGILFGTYSSIFIATPIVLDTQKLIDMWRNRKKVNKEAR